MEKQLSELGNLLASVLNLEQLITKEQGRHWDALVTNIKEALHDAYENGYYDAKIFMRDIDSNYKPIDVNVILTSVHSFFKAHKNLIVNVYQEIDSDVLNYAIVLKIYNLKSRSVFNSFLLDNFDPDTIAFSYIPPELESLLKGVQKLIL